MRYVVVMKDVDRVFFSFNARNFDSFISSSSLVDVKMEGYSFTWSHPSANKMSKLDRFLVSDGVISLFPSITAFSLDRHLSDHRPIFLCEVKLDFGLVPFRMYHSWFRYVGFDDMVVQSWDSLSFSDRNESKLTLPHDQVVIGARCFPGRKEIRRAVWDCGENKSPGPDGFTFEFFRKYWNCIGPDFCVAVALMESVLMDPLSYHTYFTQVDALVYWGVDPMITFVVERSFLSKWKAKTLSIGGRLTLLKSVLGASPLYNMSIFKVPKGVLKEMESIRNNFFKGAELSEKKITWVAWDKVLASKKKGGLGVSSYYALNRALLLKWVWRFVSQEDSLWTRVIQAIHGSRIDSHSTHLSSLWSSILIGNDVLKERDLIFLQTVLNESVAEEREWRKTYIYVLVCISGFRSLSSSLDHGHDCSHLMESSVARRDCLPTRLNLIRRGVALESTSCPICLVGEEDVSHTLFQCPLAQAVLRQICRWWE
ncbi:RNA-directed DNA polymerase, eukaryota, partial [Tanacetum coccineum]